MPQAHEPRSNRLSVSDWIQQGYEIIAEEGLNALKINRLCNRLRVTKGSFYWHFDDLPSYRDQLVQTWGELCDDDHRRFEKWGALPPRERLSRMMSALVSTPHWTMERAMREWARSDSTVADSVHSTDRRLVRIVRQAFLDHGCEPDDADLRANATFATGIGFIHLSGPHPSPREAAGRERFLDLMLKP